MPTKKIRRKWTHRLAIKYTDHGMSHTPTYKVWSCMLERCRNPNNKDYHNYGGRGITVCKRWQETFTNFLEDMGERPKGLRLDRLNNDLGYFKDNCAWRTAREQAANTRVNHWIEFDGRKMILMDWARELNISESSLLRRLSKWPLEKALTTTGPSWGRFVTYQGETLRLKDWARRFGVNYSTLIKRIDRGVPFEQAIT